MKYFVSTQPDGRQVWWTEKDLVTFAGKTIRPASQREAELMQAIEEQDGKGEEPDDITCDELRNLLNPFSVGI